MSNYHIDWQSTAAAEGIPGKDPILLPQKLLDSTSTSLTLTGKGVNNYGEIQQENFLRLMENFASATPPLHPTIGQMWFNAAETILYMRVDPAHVNPDAVLYHPQSPAAWVQVWPTTITFASIAEYSAMAATINRIIGAPSTTGGVIPENQFGWGQTDLVPEFDSMNMLKPGFSSINFPAVLDNNAWVILLSRLRKALRHLGIAETLVSPVGFINDTRPFPPGNTLANTYNNHPAVGTLPNYTGGWTGFSQASLMLFFGNTLSAISQLETNRFKMTALSSENAQLTAVTRTANWNSSKTHSISFVFANEDAAKAYFNAGGYLKFTWSHAPSVVDMINASWQSFLDAQTNLIFDYKGVRHADAYEHATDMSSDVRGFYHLTSAPLIIYERDRGETPASVYSAYNGIADGGIQIVASTATIGSSFTLNFDINFIESVTGSETIQGTTTSTAWGFKPNNLNTTSPVLAQPAAISSGTF